VEKAYICTAKQYWKNITRQLQTIVKQYYIFSLAIVGKLKQTKKLKFDYFNNVATAKKILSNKKNKYINI
jgi:hypothetical protein